MLPHMWEVQPSIRKDGHNTWLTPNIHGKNNMYVCIRMSNIRGTLGKRMSHTGTMCIVWLPCMTHTCYSYVTHISRVSRAAGQRII
ncbi:K88 minor fimbrial subunit FaeI, partial [Frankliniella fusca]